MAKSHQCLLFRPQTAPISEEAGTILEQFEAHLASPARTEHSSRSSDIADVDVGKNIAAGLGIDQTEADRERSSES